MKKTLIIGGLLIVAATVVVSQIHTNSAPSAPKPSAAKSSQTNAVLSVENFMKNVDRYRGSVRVEGVVAAVSATNQMLGLIDTREFQTCGLEKCGLSLPVRWTGPMPALGQAVHADGRVQETEGKLVLVAKTVEKIELPKQGK